jgi:hypothetical protein
VLIVSDVPSLRLGMNSVPSFIAGHTLASLEAVAKLQQTQARDFQVAVEVKAGKAQTEPYIHA